MTLDVKDLGIRIGAHRIVHDLTCSAAAGECVAVLGRNGAGKTSLVRALAGLLPSTGHITLDGQDLGPLTPAERARRIGYVAQGVGPVSVQLSTFDLLLLALNGGRLGWRVPPDHLLRVEAVLDLLQLQPLAHRHPAEMSGGQRQMVALAAALIRRPRLLLLDEPISALDLANQLKLLEVVRAYTRRERIVTLMVLHDLNMATRYADSVIMMADGRLQHAGRTESALTVARIAELFAVECCIIPVPGGHTAIYPVAATDRPTDAQTASDPGSPRRQARP